ncbi:hypothetical protein CKO15_09640 [Halorhodospira abdelmalekii]|nr:hypothetical protein [Halorhodospira abdelmalekii]
MNSVISALCALNRPLHLVRRWMWLSTLNLNPKLTLKPKPLLGVVALMVALLGATLVGCATSGREAQPQSADALWAQARDEERAGYAYGHGLGETPEAARQAALYQLAGQVVTAIRGEQREVYRSLERRGELGTPAGDAVERLEELAFESTVASLSHVAIAGAEVVREQRAAEGWVATLRVSDARMERMRAEAATLAPALAQFELLEATPVNRPGLRLDRAMNGLETVRRLDLEKRRLYVPERGETTFAVYFNEKARSAVERMRVLPVVDTGSNTERSTGRSGEAERVRFIVIDDETLQPQPGVALTLAGYRLVTDREGWTGALRLDDLSSQVEVIAERGGRREALLSREQRRIDTLYPRRWRELEEATLYLHSEPPGSVIELDGRGYTTPARVAVTPGRSYRLRLLGSDEHRDEVQRIEVAAGSPAAFYSVRLTERRFGELDLRTQGRNTRIHIEGHEGLSAAAIRRPAEAGRYTVRISRDHPRYQEVIDEIVVEPGERVQRVYAEPLDRYPFYYGWLWGLMAGVTAGEPGDRYRVPGPDGEIDYIDLPQAHEELEEIARIVPNLQLSGVAAYFARSWPLLATGSLGYRYERYEVDVLDSNDDTTSSDTVDLGSWQLTAGAGLWRPVGVGVGWLTLNYAWEQSRWGDSGADISMPGGSAQRDYLFIEAAGRYEIWSFGLRVADFDAGPGVVGWLGIGASQLDANYQRPAQVEARPGVHYH